MLGRRTGGRSSVGLSLALGLVLSLAVVGCSNGGEAFAGDYKRQTDAFYRDFDKSGRPLASALRTGDNAAAVSALNEAISAVDQLIGWQRTAHVPQSNAEVVNKVSCEFAATPQLRSALWAMRAALLASDRAAFVAADRDLKASIGRLDSCVPLGSGQPLAAANLPTLRPAQTATPPITEAPTILTPVPVRTAWKEVAAGIAIPTDLPLPPLLATLRQDARAAYDRAHRTAAQAGNANLVDWEIFYFGQHRVLPEAGGRAGITWTFEVAGGRQALQYVVGFSPQNVTPWVASNRVASSATALDSWQSADLYQLMALMAREQPASTITAKPARTPLFIGAHETDAYPDPLTSEFVVDTLAGVRLDPFFVARASTFARYERTVP